MDGQKDAALEDESTSDRLDHHNAGLKQILHDMAKVRELTLKSVTPREGLQMANARLDFTTARIYAEMILKDDPDDPYANYGKGMNFYELKQWGRAEEFLRKCLIRRPKQSAIWNNLALIYMHTERYEEALKLALELRPESDEIKDTVRQIEAARDKAKEEKKGEAEKKPDVTQKPVAKPTAKQNPVAKPAPPKNPEVKPVPPKNPKNKPSGVAEKPAAKPAPSEKKVDSKPAETKKSTAKPVPPKKESKPQKALPKPPKPTNNDKLLDELKPVKPNATPSETM